MAHAKRYLALGSLLAVVLVILFACGGGGGGGGGATFGLLGTVTDATQTAVSGATVTVYDDVGAAVTSGTTDAAGRFGFNLDAGTYIVSAELAPAYFPAGRSVTLVTGRSTVADLNLSSTRDRASQTILSTDVDSTVGAAVLSGTFIGGADRATLTIAADILETAPAIPYAGIATVYVTPVDTTRMNSGFADYQFAFPVAFGDPVPAGFLLKVYAAAGVAVVDDAGAELTTPVSAPPLVNPMVLSMPIPADPPSLRVDALASVPLWKFDPALNMWSEAGTATRNVDAYEAEIAEGGLYAAGVTATATAVTGTLQFSDAATVAGGVTVMAAATDATYRNVTTTDENGMFSVLVEDAMQADLEFIHYGSGVQQTDGMASVAPGALGTIVLADIDPSSDAMINMSGNSSTGFIPASGRIYVADTDLDTAEIADVVFVGSLNNPLYGGVATLTIDSGKSGDTLINGAMDNSVRIDDSFPMTITVQTVGGDNATITVTDVSPNGVTWDVTMRSSFQ